jgi:AraC-like DNA-binding protein
MIQLKFREGRETWKHVSREAFIASDTGGFMQASDVAAGETPISANAAMMDLCAHLFREPQRLVKAHTFTTIGPLKAQAPAGAAYTRETSCNWTFALSCNGRWIVDGRSYAVRGDTLAVFYPHEVHSYELFGDNEYARVLSIKFHIESDWAAVRQRVFTAHLPALERSEALIHTWDRLIRLSVWSALHPHQTREPLVIAHLCEVLCRFPTEDNHLRPGVGSADSVMEEALLFLERRLQRPPDLEELAAAVHLSPRQLSRRFLAATGQTPAAICERVAPADGTRSSGRAYAGQRSGATSELFLCSGLLALV